MKSHRYEVDWADVSRLLGGILIPALVFAVLMRLGSTWGFLPPPWPALDMDQTILTHQAQASRTATQADLLFLGDSSCLMDFSGKELEEIEKGQHRILNLGSLSYLGLNGYAAMLSRYAAANPGRLKTVVLLLHPEMLRGVAPAIPYLLFLSDFYAGVDPGDHTTVLGQCRGLLGLDVFRSRFLGRLPLALPGPYGYYYGFTRNLQEFMDAHRGSVVDPHQFVPRAGLGNAEYRLAPAWEPGCQAIKAAVPPGTILVIGITPVPQSFAASDFPARRDRILNQWGQWIQADVCLSHLPPVLPDSWFASITHLNEEGARRYTEILAQCLNPLLEAGRK
jgi:hypothetical protein